MGIATTPVSYKMVFALKLLGLALCVFSAASLELVTFDGAKSTTFKFTELNDPVMGGQSTGTWTQDTTKGYGTFDGQVVDVPSLKAPGFIKASADGTFPDASAALGGSLVLNVRTTTPEYEGFRVTLAAGTLSPAYACSGGSSIPFSGGCYKAKFSVPAGSSFAAVTIPLVDFSDHWSPATGEHTKECADDSSVCLTASALKGIKRVEVWAEGVRGKIHLELQSISLQSAVGTEVFMLGAAEVPAVRPPAQFDTCSGAVQPNLRFNISERMTSNPYVPDASNESMAAGVCCDSRLKPFAEPQFLFQAPDIQLFSSLDESGVTTFYDSVCGLPVFKAPVGRSLEDFEADTTEHGWPSFRTEEIVAENIVTNRTSTFVTSKCVTHLGSFLPDSRGDRWCIDLSCIS